MAPRYSWRDIPDLARSKPGRKTLKITALHRAWPLVRPLGWLYRRTALRNLHLTAVTGSFGKSATTQAIALALNGCRYTLQRNVTSLLGLTLLSTPPWESHLIIETGAGAGHMAAQAGMLKPQIAVVTSVGSEHNNLYADLKQTREAKAHLVRALSPSGLAVLNGDDPNVRWMAGQTQARVVTCGFEAHNDIRASGYRLRWPQGLSIELEMEGVKRRVKFGLLGRHQVFSALAAVAVGLELGSDLDRMLARIKGLRPMNGRMEPIKLDNGAWLLRDDNKGAKETLQACLDFWFQVPARRKFVVLGNISELQGDPKQVYRELGAALVPLASRVLFLGEYYQDLKEGMLQAGFDQGSLSYCDAVQDAIHILKTELAEGDLVLLKSQHNQRLSRVALSLMGKEVRCSLSPCRSMTQKCVECPKLEEGWGKVRQIT